MSTELRKLVKKKYTKGISINEILHPLTKTANPESLRLSTKELSSLLSKGDLAAIVGKQSVPRQVAKDKENAARIYKAFDVPLGQAGQLETAIQAYEKPKGKLDTKSISDNVHDNSLGLLKTMTVEDLTDSYKRSSKKLGVISLESIAEYLKLEYSKADKDNELAQKIVDKLK